MNHRRTIRGAFCALVLLGLVGCAAAPHDRASLTMARRLQIAQDAESAGNLGEALVVYAKAASDHPANPDLQLRYARALLRNGSIMRARDTISRALTHHPANRRLAREQGVIDIQAGDRALGVAVFDNLLADNASDWKTMVDKAVAFDLAKDHAGAQRLYCQALAIAPNAPGIATDYALSLMLQGNVAAARAVLDPYFVRYNVPTATRSDLAVIYDATGDVARARELVTASEARRAVNRLAHALPHQMNSTPPCAPALRS
jgi:Flp pilus assembly protein TadD